MLFNDKTPDTASGLTALLMATIHNKVRAHGLVSGKPHSHKIL